MELSKTEDDDDTPNFGDYSIDDDYEDGDDNNNAPETVENKAEETHENDSPSPPTPNQRQQQQQPRRPRGRTYRGGFASSICHLFQNQNSNRTDCCIFACCGTLLSDRTHYLLKKEHPTSWWVRLFFVCVIPLVILKLGDLALNNGREGEDPVDNVGYVCSRIGVIIYLILLCCWWGGKRVERRQYIVGKLYALEEEERGEEVTVGAVMVRQQRYLYDSVRAHRTFRCYPMDDGLADDGGDNQDLCGCIWNALAKLCCVWWCACWVQCCGMCAVGQEDREVVEYLVDKEASMIDFVTFQPYSDYHPKLENLRTTLNSNLWKHYAALSKLSIQLLKSLGLAVAALFIYAALDIDSNFTLENLFILLATFFQAFFILYFVHWKWKKFDLSLDAVVKYFASGFLLATAMALAFEIALSFILEIFAVFMTMILLGDKVSSENDTNDDDMIKDFVLGHPGVFIFYIFVNSFLVAALVEEIVKYFGYWMVIHPDLLDVDDVGSAISEASSDTGTSLVLEGEDNNDGRDRTGTDVQQQHSTPPARRSLNSLGDGITVAMVAVALGFACCENLLYIFVYTPPSPGLEISTLLVRSIFPVHPICAAIQSINVCQRDLEKNDRMQLGKIILPSVILHGTFDFVLMVVAFMDAYNTLKEGKDPSAEINEEETQFSWDILWKELPSFLIGFALVVVGLIYYVFRSRAQRARLNALEIGSGMALVSDTSLV